MVIMSTEGHSSIKIAEALKRNPHTVRKWLRQYNKEGEDGLQRQYSPGRPNDARKQVQSTIEEILEKSPREFDYQESLWTVALMVHYLNSQQGLTVSEDTVARALKEMGYTISVQGNVSGTMLLRRKRSSNKFKRLLRRFKSCRIGRIAKSLPWMNRIFLQSPTW